MIFGRWLRRGVKHPGEVIMLGGKSYVLPPLPLGMARLLDQFSSGAMLTEESAGAFGMVVISSLRRNYPDIKPEVVVENLDVRNFQSLFRAVIRVNGLEPAEGKPPAASP